MGDAETDDERGFRVRALGEIAIRCRDVEAMTVFYRDVLGLEVLAERSARGIVFFALGRSCGGHTAVLALFPSEGPEPSGTSSLHHLALSLPFAEQEAVMRWYEAQGVPYRVQVFDWIGWRGIFTTDPEGNTVELVAHDASLRAG